jgi:hypothetical protein
MTLDDLKILCTRTNAAKSPRWHRSLTVSIRRFKVGLSDEPSTFTCRERVFVWFGV